MNEDKIIEDYCIKNDVPGMIVAVINERGNHYYSYGYSNRERNIKVNNQTLFEIASLSKAFTALVIFLLEGKKIISLDESISQYIEGLKLCLKHTKEDLSCKITIRDLLYHTSGLGAEAIDITALTEKENISDVISKLNRHYLHFYPGEKYEYVSTNYILLAYLVEIVTKKDFSEILESVFEVLGLTNTYANRNKAIATGKMSCGYKIKFYKNRKCKCHEHKSDIASGYIISNVTDMVRWGIIQQGLAGDIPEIYKRAVERSHIPNNNVKDDNNYYYGGGWKIHIRENRIMHTGNNPAFASCIDIRLKKKSCVIVLMNVNSLATLEIADDIYRDRIRTADKPYSEGINKILDVINSNICLLNLFLLISMLVISVPSMAKLWLFAYIGCGVLLFIQYLYIKIAKKASIKLSIEWVADSFVWSYVSYLFLCLLLLCKHIL